MDSVFFVCFEVFIYSRPESDDGYHLMTVCHTHSHTERKRDFLPHYFLAAPRARSTQRTYFAIAVAFAEWFQSKFCSYSTWSDAFNIFRNIT